MKRALIILTLLLGAPAGADTSVEAFGSAAILQGDTAAARDKALDEAFRQAVDQAIGAVVAPPVREANADLIRKRILRRAKSYVLVFKILDEGEGEAGGSYRVHISADLAGQNLAADLAALGLSGAAPTPTPTPTRPEPPAAPRPKLVLLAVTTDGKNAWSTFGRGQPDDEGPAAGPLVAELEAYGWTVLRAHGLSAPPRAGGGIGELPLDTEQAADLARQVGAGGALVAAIKIKDDGPIRGTRLAGVEVEITVMLVDSGAGGGEPARLAEERAAGAGYAAERPAAQAAALKDAAVRIGRAVQRRLEAHWPTPVSGGEGTPVRVRGVSRWPDVSDLARVLAGLPGTKQVLAARFAPREVTLVVKGPAAPDALAGAIAAAPLAGAHAEAHVAGGGVDVELSTPPAVLPSPPQ